MENRKITLKEWSEDDRPREKLLAKGISVLSDAELIAILIGSGNKNETAVELARRILLDQNSNLNELGKMTIVELMKYRGIGEAKAISIVAALELGRRRGVSEIVNKNTITQSEDVFEIMQAIIGDSNVEKFWTIYLNKANKILRKEEISSGTITQTPVEISIIMKHAILNSATSMILCHNHPSGNVTPSEQDLSLTENIKNAAKYFNIRVLDHIIISSETFYSFADEGILLLEHEI
jgi:DNA repair protein RadC